jgi:hypothetical protein
LYGNYLFNYWIFKGGVEAKPPVKGRSAGLTKIDNFLPSQKHFAIVFQNDRAALAGASHRRRGTGTSGLKAGSDSEMAPQAIEIAQNGLGDPSARARWEEESIRANSVSVFFPEALPEARFASTARSASAFLGRRQARL